MIFRSLCLSGAKLAQKLNSFICKKINLIFWHPWDPWGRVHIDLDKNSVQTGCVQRLQVGDSLWEPPCGHINAGWYQKYISYRFAYHLYITFHHFCGKLMPCTVFYWTLRPAGKNIESRPANEATKGVYFVLLCASKTLVPTTPKYPYNWLKTWYYCLSYYLVHLHSVRNQIFPLKRDKQYTLP